MPYLLQNWLRGKTILLTITFNTLFILAVKLRSFVCL